MYGTINGWTKERMKATIREKNNGNASRVDDACLYMAPDGNRCAAGCFIPDGHVALRPSVKNNYSAEGLISRGGHSDLLCLWPLEIKGMNALQASHDYPKTGPVVEGRRKPYTPPDMREHLCAWIDENVVDSQDLV